MPDKAFIDTNIVIYALGSHSSKTSLAASLFVGNPIISTQVLSEMTNICIKKLGLPLPEIRRLISTLEEICTVELITSSTIGLAFEIIEKYHFSWYDSLIIATALQAGCDTLFTEDLQHDQTINGCLTIINPLIYKT